MSISLFLVRKSETFTFVKTKNNHCPTPHMILRTPLGALDALGVTPFVVFLTSGHHISHISGSNDLNLGRQVSADLGPSYQNTSQPPLYCPVCLPARRHTMYPVQC